MRLIVVSSVLTMAAVLSAAEKKEAAVPAALNFKMDSLTGKPIDLSQYKGKVVMMVNVASQCGLTPQYKSLQQLHEKYAKDGLVILGFPANDFGKQEPGSNEEISEFCQTNYGVKFQMFSKVSVKGEDSCELYKFLTSKKANAKLAGPIQWNFEKFLVNRKGQVVARFNPQVNPDSADVVGTIEKELAKK